MSTLPRPAEKAEIWTVSELTEAIRERLEGAFPEIWVRGEVSNFRRQSSGHCYFSLKDGDAQVSAVLFRMDAARQNIDLRDGMEVVGFGRVSLYAQRGTYQVIFRLLVDEGAGRLRRAFEALKARLGEEGLFDAARKRTLPRVPLRVGFVTSPTGAALQDFKRILERRGWRGEVWVYPARVQGNGAAEEIAAMIARANAQARCEILIVGRGGGSLEDLWAFNEEVVVRAIAASRIPTVSAVGHEIDVALSDLAADVRAETPSAAAEMISSSFLEFLESFAAVREELDRTLLDRLRRARERMELWKARAARFHPQMRLQNAALRLDDLQGRMQRQARQRLDFARDELQNSARALREIRPEERLRWLRQKVTTLEDALRAFDVSATLRRGFVLLHGPGGRLLHSRSDLRPGMRLRARFHDGEAELVAPARIEQTEISFDT
ncbi:MAG: exodeoxyribonuclease VII large subunit [Opitutales bacterium]|nr:exodeoxyribonuclease VII large subunit [Opitutales bacterium]